jgi:hypothetical protein
MRSDCRYVIDLLPDGFGTVSDRAQSQPTGTIKATIGKA